MRNSAATRSRAASHLGQHASALGRTESAPRVPDMRRAVGSKSKRAAGGPDGVRMLSG